ncbi:MAG: hypothetical protein HY960_11490 [Ignavibacteriae bacterium]|nr:hypothetical protein [Ignavibacteriota bacterium]
MKHLFVFLLLIPSVLLAENYWQQHVHYKIDATLDPKSHKIFGKEKLIYTNNSPDTLKEIYFRLYWNYFTEGSRGEELARRAKYYWHESSGGTTINKFSIVDGESEISPKYSIDNTIMRIELPSPLPPSSVITFSVDWTGKIPQGGNRTGHDGRDYDIAQWYPQISCYDKYGWDKSQYLGPAEFHNDYGTFDVNITLPKSFTLGFTGELTNPEEVYADSIRQKLLDATGKTETVRIADYSTTQWKNGEDSTNITWKFHAENVRDFAWSANENYIWDVAHYNPNDGQQEVTIHSLYFPDKAEFWKNAAEYGRFSIQFFSEHFGRYPYKNCFVVEGPIGGGMEYPGITFIGHYGDKNSHSPFGVIAHEVGHNWFPMIVGSNETNFAFMDEGFATFMTAKATEEYWGRYDNSFIWTEWYQKFFAFPNDNVRDAIQRESIELAQSGYEEPIATHIYRFTESHYGTSIYSKTAASLYMLEYVLGDSLFETVMKEYYRKWQFKLVYPENFYSTIHEVSRNRDLRWFFDQWYDRTFTCDYGICGLDYELSNNNNEPVYKTKFHIYRLGKAIMPLDVQIEMADGNKRTVYIPVDKWFNAEVDFDTTIELPAKPVRAEINPDGRILDMNRLNNRTGFVKTKIEFDNTMMSIAPINAYNLRWRPSFWYTDEGGMNLGYKVTGSYLEDLSRFTFYQLYNTREQTFNYDLSLSHNMYKISPITSFDARAYTLEGRTGYALVLNKGFRNSYSVPPYHNLHLQYAFSELMNKDYLLNPFVWDEGKLHRIIAGYTYFNRGQNWTVNAAVYAEGSSSLFGQSDFQYSKRTVELKSNITLPNGSVLGVRVYNGVGFGNIPQQVKFYAGGSSPLEHYNAAFLRSKGMLPTEIRDHAFAPGGGNVRGYYSSMISGEKIDAFNLEWKWNSTFPWYNMKIPYANYVLKYFRGSLFLDAARLSRSNERLWDERFELDFGIGFRLASLNSLLGEAAQSNIFTGLGLRTLRIDFPFFMTKPLPGENKFKFRWVISLSEQF